MGTLKINPIVLQGTELGLGVVRSLGMTNIKSILIYSSKHEIARVSKYVSRVYKCPPWSNIEEVKDFLIKKRDDLQPGILIPTTDLQIEALARYKKELMKYYIVPVPDFKIAKLFFDKKETCEIAKKAGIDYPITFYPNSMEEALKNVKDMQFPLMIKPREHDRFYDVFHKKLFIVGDILELEKKLALCFEHNFRIMVTEIIPGLDNQLYEYNFYVDKSGEIIAGLCDVKLRQIPPNYGVARVLKTVVNLEVERIAKKFLNYIPGFFGPGQLEFKLDPRDKKYKLIEMNGRITLQNELYTKAGINFAHLYYQEWVNNKSIKVDKFLKDFYWVHLFNDIVLSIFQHNEEKYSIKDYIKPYLRKHMYGIESFSDPKPMILFWSQKGRNAFKFFVWVFRILLSRKKGQNVVY